MTDPSPCRVLVCTHYRFGPRAQSCALRGSEDLLAALQQAVAEGRLAAEVEVGVCFGHCTIGPNVKIVGGPLLHGVAPHDVATVVEAVAARSG